MSEGRDLPALHRAVTSQLQQHTRAFRRLMAMSVILALINLAFACLWVTRLHASDANWFTWACVAMSAYSCYYIVDRGRLAWLHWRSERACLQALLTVINKYL